MKYRTFSKKNSALVSVTSKLATVFAGPNRAITLVLLIWLCGMSVASAQQDLVNGNLIMMNDNGGWCWYQDERTLFDQTTGCVLFGSVGSVGGINGSVEGGDIDVTSFDLNTGLRTSFELNDRFDSDDHNVPALWQRPDGRYIAAYTGHADRTGTTRFHISENPHDVSEWQAEFTFNWNTASGVTTDTTYNNLLYVSAEGTGDGRLYNVTRYYENSPIVSYSDDWGETWNYAGPMTLPLVSGGSNNGYVKFTTNGVDRIDFTITEAHPRNYNNSIYHGYIQGGQTYNSTGQVIDTDLFDTSAPPPQAFTPVFAAEPEDGVNDDTEYHRGWTAELERDDAGNIYTLFTTRYGTETTLPEDEKRRPGDADHRLFYARLDAVTSQWSVTELCNMGEPLYANEQDYTGLGCINPKDPNTIYVSTAIDPRNDTDTAHREIYKGNTFDQGATWQWTAITENSLVENLRPIIPSGDGSSTAVLWLRGSLRGFMTYHETVVGIIDRPNEWLESTHYVDADRVNTTFADGSTLVTTGPNSSRGPSDDLWHERTGYGNEGSIFASNESGEEDTPILKTTLTDVADGTYDVFAYFWANINEEWLIEVGFTEDAMVLCEKQGSQQAEAWEFDEVVLTSEGTNRALYRAYVGRTDVDEGSISVFIDDLENATSGRQRVWYDGLGYASVVSAVPGDANGDGCVDGSDVTILANNWQVGVNDGQTADWLMGDFNGDGQVDGSDVTILANNWQHGVTSAAAAVPEPSTVILIVTLLLTLGYSNRSRKTEKTRRSRN